MEPYIIRLVGGVTIHRYPEIRAVFATAIESDAPVLVDLRSVPHADSVFLSELLLMRRRVSGSGRRFAVIIDDGHVLRVLTLARLTERLELFPTEEAALAYLEGAPTAPAGEGERPVPPG